MAKSSSLPLQTLYAELIDRAAVARLQADFLVQGSFFTAGIKGRPYGYFQGPQQDGQRAKRYVGPDTPELQATNQANSGAKVDYRRPRELVSAFTMAGLKAPDDRQSAPDRAAHR